MQNKIQKLENQIKTIKRKIKSLHKKFVISTEKQNYIINIKNNSKEAIIIENQENQINIFDVANYIINNFSKKYKFTHMKLQKIIFYIYVEYLLTYKKPLFQENIEAWRYGPVFPNLYLSLMHHHANLIKTPIEKGNDKKLTNKHKDIINKNIKKYGSWQASELVDKVHEEKAWKYNFLETDWSNNIISDEDLYKYCGKK